MFFSNRMSLLRTAFMALLALGVPALIPLFVPAALAQSTIRILVNDDAITNYDISQRAQMLRVFSRNQQGEKEAIEQLIDERLMVQEAQRQGATASEEEIDEEIG